MTRASPNARLRQFPMNRRFTPVRSVFRCGDSLRVGDLAWCKIRSGCDDVIITGLFQSPDLASAFPEEKLCSLVSCTTVRFLFLGLFFQVSSVSFVACVNKQ